MFLELPVMPDEKPELQKKIKIFQRCALSFSKEWGFGILPQSQRNNKTGKTCSLRVLLHLSYPTLKVYYILFITLLYICRRPPRLSYPSARPRLYVQFRPNPEERSSIANATRAQNESIIIKQSRIRCWYKKWTSEYSRVLRSSGIVD
jgi:hypothetical protein